jgi:hypothetical protein|tara:strand:+ start:119 stop:307 length:189 start_codon:yes stop_codon:yes gene_type:complete
LSKQWTVKVEEDPETGEVILPFPPDLLSQMGWDFGDTLIWDDNLNGTFSIKKKVDNTDEKKV